METESFETALLANAKDQARTLRSLYNLGLAWTVVIGLALVTWLFLVLAR